MDKEKQAFEEHIKRHYAFIYEIERCAAWEAWIDCAAQKDAEIARLKDEIERLSQALILISNIAFAGKDYRGNWRDDIYSVCQKALTKTKDQKP